MTDAPVDPITIGVVDRIRARQRFSVPYFSDPQTPREQMLNEWMQQADHDVAQLLQLLQEAEDRVVYNVGLLAQARIDRDTERDTLQRVKDLVAEWRVSAARPLNNPMLDYQSLHADLVESAIERKP